MSGNRKKRIVEIFDKVQCETASHPKCLKLLADIYKSTSLDTFTKIFVDLLKIIAYKTADKSEYMKRFLTFCSKFCGEITRMEDQQDNDHPFLTRVLTVVLKWSCADNYELRYNSCHFITKLLQEIGDDSQLDVDLIEEIQKVLLDRVRENKVQMRQQALLGLLRLQDPHNTECPVMRAYLQELTNGNVNIRRLAITHIAPSITTMAGIKERIRDVDSSVRSVAFQRLADVGPLVFKIAEKHTILLCAFKDTHPKVRKTVDNYLLSKWLTAYGGNFLKFVASLKLVACEEDLKKMEFLSQQLIKHFYEKYPIKDLISALPIGEEKVVKETDLSNEVTLFWRILVNLLRESEDMMENYLDELLPELTPFCGYLERFIKFNKSGKDMDEWQYSEYQFDLFNLLEIAENYDFSDEVGRRSMASLTFTMLQDHRNTVKVTKKIITIAHRCSSNIDIFTNDICQIISEIREPMIEQPLSEQEQLDKNFQIAQIRFKITLLEDQKNEAVEAKDYQAALQLSKELAECNRDLEQMRSTTNNQRVKVVKSDRETMCRCLDILMGLLQLPEVTKLTPSMVTCKEELVVPLITSQDGELHWRMLVCLTLFALVDRATAEEYAMLICFPMATYRSMPNNNVSVLTNSVGGTIDLIVLYGLEIVGLNTESETTITTTNQSVTKRKLYNKEDVTSSKHDSMTFSDIFEILFEMLDDERNEVKHKAIFAIGSLIEHGFPVTASVVSRLILKWFNPLTGKQDSFLQVGLGLLIDLYLKKKNSYLVIKDAIVPTLSCIASAPNTSPLSDIDGDNLVCFFANLVNAGLAKDDIKILGLDMCMKLSENLDSRLASLLVKFLNNLTIPRDADELIDRVEMLSESITDKISKKQIAKFLSKLKEQQRSAEAQEQQTVDEVVENGVLQETTGHTENRSRQEPSEQIKRRKQRIEKRCVVILERFNDEKNVNETALETIVESSMEMMQIDEDSTSQTESSTSVRKVNKTVISETSDSDFSSDGRASRRSNRIRKKRIV